MTLKGGTSQACAACKYQRRRCLPECQLAPYFPADQPKMFQNAHRLFGVSNILKILKDLDPSLRAEAMRSIIYESDVRNKSPVLGCYGFINELQCRVRLAEEELHTIRSQIASCKMQQCQNNNDNGQILIGDQEDSISLLQLGMGPTATNNNDISNNPNVSGMMMIFENGGFVRNDQFWGNQGCGVVVSNHNNITMESQLSDVQGQQYLTSSLYHHPMVNVGIQQHDQIQTGNLNNNLVHHFEGMHPFLDGIDDRQSFNIDSKAVQGYESSSSDSTGSMKVALKSTDLKNAAAHFCLTN